MHELVTEIDIRAPAARVWTALTDFHAYGAWNPLIESIDGPLKEGGRLQARLRPEALRQRLDGPIRALIGLAVRAWYALNGMCITVRVAKLRPGRELRWVGTLPVPGLFEGEHFFIVSDERDGLVRFTQGERYSGVLEPVFREVMEIVNGANYRAANCALKRHVEALCASAG